MYCLSVCSFSFYFFGFSFIFWSRSIFSPNIVSGCFPYFTPRTVLILFCIFFVVQLHFVHAMTTSEFKHFVIWEPRVEFLGCCSFVVSFVHSFIRSRCISKPICLKCWKTSNGFKYANRHFWIRANRLIWQLNDGFIIASWFVVRNADDLHTRNSRYKGNISLFKHNIFVIFFFFFVGLFSPPFSYHVLLFFSPCSLCTLCFLVL